MTRLPDCRQEYLFRVLYTTRQLIHSCHINCKGNTSYSLLRQTYNLFHNTLQQIQPSITNLNLVQLRLLQTVVFQISTKEHKLVPTATSFRWPATRLPKPYFDTLLRLPRRANSTPEECPAWKVGRDIEDDGLHVAKVEILEHLLLAAASQAVVLLARAVVLLMLDLDI